MGRCRNHPKWRVEARVPRGQRSISIEGKDVIVVQAKAGRLGMYVMGQGVFSLGLMKRLKPKSVRSVILCEDDDAVLGPLLKQFPDVEVVLIKQSPVGKAARQGGPN